MLIFNIAYASEVDSFVSNLKTLIINPLVSLLFFVAMVLFLFGVAQYVINPESEEKRTQGKSHMLWGLVGMTIMFSVWGILGLVLDTLQVSEGVNPQQGTVRLKNLPN